MMTTSSLVSVPEAFALKMGDLQRALGVIAQRQVDYADLYFQQRVQESWALNHEIIRPTGFSQDQGVGVRAISGGKTAFSYTNQIHVDALLKAAATVREISRQGQSAQVPVALSAASPVASRYPYLNPLHAWNENQKHALLARIDRLARVRDPRVKEVSAHLTASWEAITIVGHDGRISSDWRPLVNLSVSVVAEQRGVRESGFSGGGRRLDYGFFADAVVDSWINEAVAMALTNLEAEPAPAGTFSVVLGAGSPGILLHEAIGHGLEGDFNRKGSSAFSQLLGERVAAPGVTIVDDGTLSERRGSLHVDDEGAPTQCTTLIEDGILRGYLQDSLNARLMGVASTGNARRASYASLPLPRMTNTWMRGGQYAEEEIVASVKHGLYAASFGGGQVDISSGKFVFSTTAAWLIENGKITRPIKGATLTGHGPQALLHVSMVGNNPALDDGNIVCSKEGQTLPVSVGQPALRIDRMTVGGSR
nr:metalloprotease TldD [Klebsiella oxytoca]